MIVVREGGREGGRERERDFQEHRYRDATKQIVKRR